MPRLFLAIDLPEAHHDALAALRTDALPARWIPPAQYHLTLHFLGDVPAPRVAVLNRTLEAVQGEVLTLTGDGLGVFPSRRQPRVLFAGVAATPALVAVQQDVVSAVQAAGLEGDPKPFTPHVTFARLRGAKSQAVRAFLKEHADFALPPFDAHAFHLYESTLTPEGAVHTCRASFALSQPSTL